MDFTTTDIICETKTSNARSTWATVKRFDKGRNAFYLYVDTNMAYIIPKRVFQTPEEEANFESLVTTHMKTRA